MVRLALLGSKPRPNLGSDPFEKKNRGLTPGLLVSPAVYRPAAFRNGAKSASSVCSSHGVH